MTVNKSFAEVTPKAVETDASFTVLIAEDNDVNIKVLEQYFTRYDCRVLIAKDGKKAVDMVERNNIDLVMMDINMPVMDGLEATRAIRTNEKKASVFAVPVIAVTAHVKPADQHLCIAAGMNDYLSKPLDFDLLTNTLDIWAPGLARLERKDQRAA